MSVRSLVSFSALAFAVTSIIPMPIAAQATQGASEAKKKAESKAWTAPLTPDGQPDLQGNWVKQERDSFGTAQAIGRPAVPDRR
jgi:hypothetical protein